MLIKSKIQIIKECVESANNYKQGLVDLMDKYLIEDSIFVYKNDNIYEVTKGYFVENNRYEELSEAINEYMTDNNKVIRIINNKEFVVGEIKNFLSECKDCDKVFDIERLSIIER